VGHAPPHATTSIYTGNYTTSADANQGSADIPHLRMSMTYLTAGEFAALVAITPRHAQRVPDGFAARKSWQGSPPLSAISV